jgi:hypothetical protein
VRIEAIRANFTGAIEPLLENAPWFPSLAALNSRPIFIRFFSLSKRALYLIVKADAGYNVLKVKVCQCKSFGLFNKNNFGL